MLEQSVLHGKVFCITQTATTLTSKTTSISDISFGPMRPIHLYVLSDNEVLVCDINRNDWYHYKRESVASELVLADRVRPASIPNVSQHFYYYGMAKYNDTNHLYFIKNVPSVTISDIPDINTFQIPITLQTLGYETLFEYPDELVDLLNDVPACYTDRYKRPIVHTADKTYPIPMDKVTTTVKDLPACAYPVVFDFKNTCYGIADLEPHHTEQDMEHFNSLDGYYVEDTPRGGKHKLIKIDAPDFKFRYSDGLEIINQSQATLYGINGTWLKDNPEPIDVTVYNVIGRVERTVVALLERPDVTEAVALLTQKANENLSAGRRIAKNQYMTDPDTSHGEYMVLWTLYQEDLLPYANQFDRQLLPWILEQYAMTIIEHREKHETMRHGLPYLVYLAAIIIEKRGGIDHYV